MLNSKVTLSHAIAAIAVMGIALVLPAFALAEAGNAARSYDRGPSGPHHRGPRGPDPGRFIEEHGDELGLDADVRESIQAIVDASRLRSEQMREEIRSEHERMHELLSQSSPDEVAVMSQNDRIESLKSRQRRNRLEAMLAIRKLLTPEQRERLIGIREERSQDRGEGGCSGKARRGPLAGCREDVAALCSKAGPGRARLRCLDAEWGNLSDDCRAAFEGRGRRGSRWDRRLDSGSEPAIEP